jgi:hypothetical protein
MKGSGPVSSRLSAPGYVRVFLVVSGAVEQQSRIGPSRSYASEIRVLAESVRRVFGILKKGGHIEKQNMSGIDIYKRVVEARMIILCLYSNSFPKENRYV